MKIEISKTFVPSEDTQKIKESLESKLLEIKASCCATSESCPIDEERLYSALRNVYDYLDSQMRYIHSSINDLYSTYYDHVSNGHIPELSAESLTKFIKLMGLENTYQVVKKPIFSSASVQEGKRNEIVLEYNK